MAASVLVVDDHRGFRETARRLLELEGYLVVGEAEDGASALVRARELHPDIVLVDVHLPDIDGFELTSRMCALIDPPHVILISSRDGAEFGPLVLRSGARGFLAKHEISREAMERLLQ